MKHKKAVGIIFVVLAIAGGLIWISHRHQKPTPSSAATSSQSSPKTSKVAFNKSQYSLSDPTSLWVVVDKKRPLSPMSYAPADLELIGNGQYLRSGAAEAYAALVSDAQKAGYTLFPESGYRSYTTQTAVYASEVKAYGQTKADTESARPGYSEHQTGFAVDIGSPGCLEDCFGKTKAAQWLLDNAYKYGFIHRYPDDMSAVTGYRNEPWHFRFVGTDLAAQIHTTGQVLEEFFGLPAAPTY